MPTFLLRFLAPPLLIAFALFAAYQTGAAHREAALRSQLLSQYQTEEAALKAAHSQELKRVVEHLQATSEREVVFQTIEKEVIKYVTANEPVSCLNSDGVRLWNAIAEGTGNAAD